MVATLGGMALPAPISAAVVQTAGGEGLRGRAIPIATDIARTLAALTVVSSHLAPAGRGVTDELPERRRRSIMTRTASAVARAGDRRYA